MTDNPQEPRRSGRTGPLGNDPDEASSEAPTSASRSEEETQQVPRQQTEDEMGKTRAIPRRERRASGSSGSDDQETRVIRTGSSGRDGVTQGTSRQGAANARGYFESEDERLGRLREIYGGVDWLASFLGFVFAIVAGGFLFGVASLILVPLGISVVIGAEITTAAITALVLLAVLVFITYLFGGYISGRLARFDGGRNGVMSVVWTLLVGFLLFVAGTFLPGTAGEAVRNFYQESLLPALTGLLDLGLVGIGIIAGVIVIAALGGLVGGKIGSRYHDEIDQTT